MKGLLIRYPILMAILFAIFSLFSLYEGFNESQSTNVLVDHPEKLSMAEIGRRMNQGGSELNVELMDGKIDCNSLNYLETTYALVVKEYTAYVLISSADKSIVLYSFYKGTPSCDEIGSKPIIGIVMKMEDAAKVGMYKTNLMGIRNYPDAVLLRFCGGCTKASENQTNYLYYGVGAFTFLGFIFSMYYQWKKWSEEGKEGSNP